MSRRTLDIIIIVRSHFFPDHRRWRGAERDAFTQRNFFHKSAFLAQLVEHLFCKQAVTGSIPVEGSI